MGSLVTRGMVNSMIGSIPIPNTRFYLTSIDGKKWFVTEYYRTAPFNPDKETYDLYKAFAEAFQKNEREEREFPEELKNAVNKAYGNGLLTGGVANYENKSRKSTALRNNFLHRDRFYCRHLLQCRYNKNEKKIMFLKINSEA